MARPISCRPAARRRTAACGALALLALAAAPLAPRAGEPVVVEVTIRDHRFSPAELRVPAGTPFTLRVTNADATAEELESSALQIEKVIPGGKSAAVRVRALEKGRYPFVGEYHEDTAAGAVIAE